MVVLEAMGLNLWNVWSSSSLQGIW